MASDGCNQTKRRSKTHVEEKKDRMNSLVYENIHRELFQQLVKMRNATTCPIGADDEIVGLDQSNRSISSTRPSSNPSRTLPRLNFQYFSYHCIRYTLACFGVISTVQ